MTRSTGSAGGLRVAKEGKRETPHRCAPEIEMPQRHCAVTILATQAFILTDRSGAGQQMAREFWPAASFGQGILRFLRVVWTVYARSGRPPCQGQRRGCTLVRIPSLVRRSHLIFAFFPRDFVFHGLVKRAARSSGVPINSSAYRLSMYTSTREL